MSDREFSNAIALHIHPLSSFALRLTQDIDDSKDLLQETLLKAYLNRSKFIKGSNLGAWLVTIMKNSFINHYRKKKNIKEYSASSLDNTMPLTRISIENSGLENMATEDIVKEINQLEDKIKAPFVMYIRGFKYIEIANRLNIPMGSVKNRIFIARTKLKERLYQKEIN